MATICSTGFPPLQDVAVNYFDTFRILGAMEWFKAAAIRLKAMGETQESMAAEIGVGRGAVGHWLTGRREPGVEDLRKMARFLKWSVEDLLAGNPDAPSVRLGVQEPQHVYVGGEETDLIFVNRVVGAKLAAGTGEILWEADELEKSHGYRRDYMQAKGLNPDRCKVWAIRGDSMEPKYSSGDVLLIDMSDREPRHGKVFALIGDDGLRVKQLLRTETGWLMHSYNPDKFRYPDEPLVKGNYAIIGRVRAHAGDDD